jgi:hypothetical protein
VVKLQAGDDVRTESGEVGKVVHISQLTVFVAIRDPGQPERMLAFLESQLTKVEPPREGSGGPASGEDS